LNDQAFEKHVGSTVGGCRITRRIGAGGMGVVFEAHHLALDKRVALKMLMPGLAADSSFVKRFVTEARLAAQVEHPNIVQVLNVGQDGEVYFIIMQFVEGRSLAEIISRGPLAPRDAAKIALQAARGLAAAHKRGIIHRDVKPENILVDNAGVARIVDMGLSKNLASPSGGSETAALTAPGVAMGTPHYISPEQATEARTADARADIYSLGATLYHALVGATPFSGPSAIAIINAHINAPLPPPSAKRPDVPPELDRLVGRMMAKAPEARIQSMDEVIAELRKFLAGAHSAVVAGGAAEASADAPAAPTVPAARRVVIGKDGILVSSAKGTVKVGGEGISVARADGSVVVLEKRPGGKWKYVLRGVAGTIAVLVVLAILVHATDPARKAFRLAQYNDRHFPDDYDGAVRLYRELGETYPNSQWSARAQSAITAVEQRRAADGQKALEEISCKAELLEKSADWAGAEKLWQSLPAQLRETEGGKAVTLRADRAHVARRSTEFFAALAEGKPEGLDRANTYCDPRQDEKARRFLLGVIVGVVKLSKGTAGEFQVDSVEVTPPDRALLHGHFTISYGALKPPERHPADQYWQRIGEEWFLVEKPRTADDPGPKRPRLQDRPARPGSTEPF
jgi:hypothetical protein